jgi:hypothetical protein
MLEWFYTHDCWKDIPRRPCKPRKALLGPLDVARGGISRPRAALTAGSMKTCDGVDRGYKIIVLKETNASRKPNINTRHHCSGHSIVDKRRGYHAEAVVHGLNATAGRAPHHEARQEEGERYEVGRS